MGTAKVSRCRGRRCVCNPNPNNEPNQNQNPFASLGTEKAAGGEPCRHGARAVCLGQPMTKMSLTDTMKVPSFGASLPSTAMRSPALASESRHATFSMSQPMLNESLTRISMIPLTMEVMLPMSITELFMMVALSPCRAQLLGVCDFDLSFLKV